MGKIPTVNQPTALLLQDNCLHTFPHIPDSSINLILCDLPYGTTKNSWDSPLPLSELFGHYWRVLRPNGTILLMSQGLFTATLMLQNARFFKYKLTWVKSKATGFLNAKKQPLRKHEDICVFYRKQPVYHPQMTDGEAYDKGIRKNQQSGSYGSFSPSRISSSGNRYPTDVLYFKTAEAEGEIYHPTQKPLTLARYLIRTYSNPGDIVLDNAFGSGTIPLAAIMEHRYALGIEKNEQMFLHKTNPVDCLAVAQQRITAHAGAHTCTVIRDNANIPHALASFFSNLQGAKPKQCLTAGPTHLLRPAYPKEPRNNRDGKRAYKRRG